ncbi:bifunctional diguanylate cyclase/phosphodiesterase [Actinoplanes sp. KI2]|uniref:putative bifunctional diguanylate cyclase/phosphodiesterase n=1 Tax=Actinoplanes sp. KI2 TaxID=2983315 RepID=UPI0021D5FD37|nr:bifunctional diguanylate cyclase/phosphodiesterase [Actinoplanes sp. KI2]MCU7730463.1 bifunctional diguanylate cyclase/phosphodiesterase [Actinoplanes sp. KI2]
MPHAPVLGDLATPVTVIDADTGVGEIEALIRADPETLGLVAVDDGTTYVLDRPYLESVLAGRLGYGRALMFRRPARSILPEPALVLPAATAWDDAARAVLNRPAGAKSLPVVVSFDDGRLGIAPVGPLVEHLSRRYESLAQDDVLTGLGNRRRLAEVAGDVLARDDRPVALLLIDLDRFKEINDELGHSRGDDLLRRVASVLAEAFPDRVYRLGGDEFVVLLDDLADESDEYLEKLARRLLHDIQGPFTVAGVPITVEASAGVARTTPGRRDLGDLLAGADTAMYAAKRHRTAVEVWRPELAAESTTDLRLLAELRTAIDRGELVLYYQPLVDARTGRVESLEALVRWDHPRHGLLTPAAFLAEAERSEMITAMTDRILADAVRQTARWHRDGWRVPVAVNLPAPVLAQDRIVGVIAGLLAEYDLPAGALKVEITESAVMTRPERSADRLRAIRELGVRIAMDDFGTGYTSLALLTRLPLDELKLDRSFVHRIHDPRERAIVEAVAAMARGLRLTLVAEGVEDQQTADILRDAGFDVLQGYHFGRPAPPVETTRRAA